MFLDERLNTMKIPVLSKLVYRFDVISLKVPAVYFVSIYKVIPNFKPNERSRGYKENSEESEQSQRTNTKVQANINLEQVESHRIRARNAGKVVFVMTGAGWSGRPWRCRAGTDLYLKL